MKTKNSKTVKEILSKLNPPPETFAEYREKSARNAHEMLGKVLRDVDLQRELS